jgi:hypothetical protein
VVDLVQFRPVQTAAPGRFPNEDGGLKLAQENAKDDNLLVTIMPTRNPTEGKPNEAP